MNDRELLELAAKAAGIVVIRSRLDDPMSRDLLVKASHRNPFQVAGPWNPLAADGDALRLAVKLRMGIEINERSIVASWVNGGYEPSNVYEHPDSIQDHDFHIVYVNHDKATRRAIVRAAAEIGRQMQEGGAK